ncbi:LysM peptidoglycan-binding domain-containing protein [Gordonia sp. PKS22-38]|uniref:LysM peptidoglycan-binding domain-containing protein n=1 Tax=Gordonia prachuapensis TaxID=3115651 RepID=A0ABU7MS97_9ACTN|nr:LysM peptidoglycan-binding domain-containing protein [Gordonia sp. PKS22-38]
MRSIEHVIDHDVDPGEPVGPDPYPHSIRRTRSMSTATISTTTISTTELIQPGRQSVGNPHRAGRVGAPVTRPPRRGAHTPVRPADRRPVGQPARPGTHVAGTRCDAPVVDRTVIARRRATAASVLVGAALALMVWVVAIVGSDYAASVEPAPVGTEVVHVRQGDSLSTIADRVAPGVPRDAVIAQIVERNDLSSSGLRVGQALVAPAYR